MTNQFPYDVFLSHNVKDKPRVRRLAERLRKPEPVRDGRHSTGVHLPRSERSTGASPFAVLERKLESVSEVIKGRHSLQLGSHHGKQANGLSYRHTTGRRA